LLPFDANSTIDPAMLALSLFVRAGRRGSLAG